MKALRLEELLVCQMSLRKRCSKADQCWLFEIELAIDEITSGESNTHTACVEAWAHRYILESSAA